MIADFLSLVDEPRELAQRLDRQPGVVEHGLFPPELVDLVIVARGGSTEVTRFPAGG
jgi:ribose 5-phosphate isomerase A